MSLRDNLLAQRAEIDRKLAIIDRVGEDTFPIGTIVIFSSANEKVHFLKTGEEAWRYMTSSVGTTKQLRDWILDWEDSPVGYFEVYRYTPADTPFYASA